MPTSTPVGTKSRAILAALLLAAPCGCEGDDFSAGGEPLLERADVEGLPSGSGMGSATTGRYVITGFDQRRCSCAQGPSGEICAAQFAASGLLLAQLDGDLALEVLTDDPDLPQTVLVGGLDLDGGFLVGGVSPIVDFDGNPIGDSVTIAEGIVEPMSGGDMEWTSRSRAVSEGVSIDCSAVYEISFSWVAYE